MQESDYATLARRRRENYGLKYSSTNQLKRAIMEKRLCRVKECNNINIVKIYVFKDTKFQPFVVGDENLEVASEIVE